jgi:hypothetical protein
MAKGKHYFDGKDWYADTMFMNKISGALPGFELRHLGMGEFNYERAGSADSIDFDRMRGKTFPGQSGRSDKLYDNEGGKLVKKLIAAMEKKGKSERVTKDESVEPHSDLMTEARALAGITPRYEVGRLSNRLEEKKFKKGDIVRRTRKAMKSMGIHKDSEGKVVGYQGKWPRVQWQEYDDAMPQAEAGLELKK